MLKDSLTPVTTTFDEQTAITARGGGFVAQLCPDWQGFGPLGGYLVGLGLRAAAEVSAQPIPANATAQFIGRPSVDQELELQPRVIRKSSTAECIGITAVQDGRVAFDVAFWFVADAETAEPYAQHRDLGADPRTLTSMDLSSKGLLRWDNIVERFPVRPFEEERPVLDPPIGEEWFTFRSRELLKDPVLGAAYVLILADAAPWLAMNWGRPPISRNYFPSTITLSVQFNRTAELTEHLLVRGEGAAIRHDAYSGFASVWAEDGRLVASATQDNLIRRYRN